MKRNLRRILTMTLPALFVLGISTVVRAQPLGPVHRLAADFQWCDLTTFTNCFEIATTAPPGPSGTPSGGVVAYEKTLFVPFSTLYVTFSAQGDSHAGSDGQSARLLMACTIDDGTGEAFCNPNTGLPDQPPGWMTLLKLPNPGTGGCGVGGFGDGGGGSGDCHDNSIYATWCIKVTPGLPQTIRLRLASSNGGTVFYERAHIYVDMTPNRNADNRCVNLAAPLTP